MIDPEEHMLGEVPIISAHERGHNVQPEGHVNPLTPCRSRTPLSFQKAQATPHKKPKKLRALDWVPSRSCWSSSLGAGLRWVVRHGSTRERARVLTLMNVGEHTTLGNGDMTQKLVQLLIVPYREREMARDDARLLVVAGRITSQLENFGGKVLKNGGEIDRSACFD